MTFGFWTAVAIIAIVIGVIVSNLMALKHLNKIHSKTPQNHRAGEKDNDKE